MGYEKVFLIRVRRDGVVYRHRVTAQGYRLALVDLMLRHLYSPGTDTVVSWRVL